ncbi:hypothetical protein GCM10010503_49960 [Streptomyces lucensis JCM 4490]|uniref:Uncharacterized protein n=1 Tax=Streptomyces lucensis JCM 4490 TaxID=1306176 RepID=A0A918J9W9_9ACTN|nr:hypothetical protein [Streptomyces lucensis]GGW66707.1 hypothetical protein GCM10010503_49960 [Streptomyces lucensis JCM 4490]
MPMRTRTRTLKFTAVLTFVVLGLTGFSTGRHHSRHGSGGGGGCSSSHQDHDTSSTSTSGGGSYGDDYGGSGTSGTSGSTTGGYRSRPTHRSTSTATASATGSGRQLKDGTAELVSCATPEKPYATLRITNPNDREAEFQARAVFYDDEGTEILDNASYTVKVPANGTATTRVTVGDRLRLKVDHCKARPKADARP